MPVCRFRLVFSARTAPGRRSSQYVASDNPGESDESGQIGQSSDPCEPGVIMEPVLSAFVFGVDEV